MKLSIRYVAEYYNPETGEVIDSKVLREDGVKAPKTIHDLGYIHSDQIKILQLIQDFKLKYESQLINKTLSCPLCGSKTSGNGMRESQFHAALTDHKVRIQRRACKCGWSSPYSVESIYGSSLHPDLVEKQVIQGAENSYRQASRQLNAESTRSNIQKSSVSSHI